eukprot:400580_1
MLIILSLIFCSFASVWSASLETQGIGVYYFGNLTAPFEYLRGTIIVPGDPLPAMNDQFVYYYFGLAKKRLQASVIVVFCGNASGCWDDSIGPGYYMYAELSRPNSGHYAGGAKVYIAPGEAAEVIIIQSGTFLSVNVTKMSDGANSYFDIYGANDGGLIDIVSGVALQYESNQKNICEDYSNEAFVVSNIVAVETGGLVVNDIEFKLDGNENNTCSGTIEVGTNGKNLEIFGTK